MRPQRELKNIKHVNRQKGEHSKREKPFIQKLFGLGPLLHMGYRTIHKRNEITALLELIQIEI